MNALAIAFVAYVPIVIAGLVAITTCLIAGRRQWSKGLCIVGLALTGLLLLLLTGEFVAGAAETGGYHGEAGMAGAILFCAWIPIAVEFFGLLAVAWRLGLLRKRSTQMETPPRLGGNA
jgi:hypothetical protein